MSDPISFTETMFPRQSGPCVICGDTNYALSCGGPTICPKCDCVQFDAATVEKQAKVIADLRRQLVSETRDAFYAGFMLQVGPQNVADVDRVIREEEAAWAEYRQILSFTDEKSK